MPAMKELTKKQALLLLRNKVIDYGTQKLAAEALGVSQTIICHTLQGRSEIQPKLLDALGLERVVTYRPKAAK